MSDCTTTCGPGVARESPNAEIVSVGVSITENAVAQLGTAFENASENAALMVGVLSGGCSGYSYDMQISEVPEGSFQRLTVEGIAIAIHNDDSSLLDGIEIDYVDSLMGGGFRIENPQATRNCGCGMSFG